MIQFPPAKGFPSPDGGNRFVSEKISQWTSVALDLDDPASPTTQSACPADTSTSSFTTFPVFNCARIASEFGEFANHGVSLIDEFSLDRGKFFKCAYSE